MGLIHRDTMFKVPDPENQRKLLDAYRVLAKDQAKDGKPYILHVQAGRLLGDPRSNGYTVMAQTTFASLEDMKYYDTACPAHTVLRKMAVELVTERPLVVAAKEEETEKMAAEMD
ncbi:hypothetical protein C8A00DRAFT_30106 [Chaetomidium leptoderma]|uniref:Stress-response A/B barrel domain-containing protein n=1 Tax=Chaetomidium leptoderma TaxID=669021 RepID=A0AAN6ZZZ0_9PEZI|nr:hypothetical protein C8A00DRAFT_30106 [Chaetomidium leptoderma]